MSWYILYHSAILHKGKWIPKVAYIRNGIPLILEGDPRCPYNTYDEARTHAPELEAYLRKTIDEPEAPPPGHSSAACGA